jgi:1,4-dihydroxy-6-naphthoate synthase
MSTLHEITLGHTPDADDAFMFYGIASGNIKSCEFKIRHVIEDIETLNKRALQHELDITAVSAHAYAYLEDYMILRSGGSFGLKYGPIVISKKKKSKRRKKEKEKMKEDTRICLFSIVNFVGCNII